MARGELITSLIKGGLVMKSILKSTLGFVFTAALAGCSQTSSFDYSTADTVGSSIAGASNAADNNGSVVAFNKVSGEKKPLSVVFKEFVASNILIPNANAASCWVGAMVQGTSCSLNGGTTMDVTLNSCTGLLGAVWTGTYQLAFNSAGACTNASASGLMQMGSGNDVVLTSSGGVTRTSITGYYVTVDSNNSGYSQTLGGGMEVTCNSSDCSTSPGRTVTIQGIHRALYNPSGAKVYDHTVSSTVPFTITGVGSAKVISAGTLQVQHNLAHFVATAAILTPLTFTANCCHPTGGSVDISYVSGSKSGTETVTFGPSCGMASTNGNSFVLTYCQ